MTCLVYIFSSLHEKTYAYISFQVSGIAGKEHPYHKPAIKPVKMPQVPFSRTEQQRNMVWLKLMIIAAISGPPPSLSRAD